MADSSCSGPSPFKRLVQHQSRDVSLHQDRLVDRSALNSQASFRSAPPAPLSQQDSFGAFVNSPASVPGPHDAAGRLAAYAAALQPVAAPAPPSSSSWAADFARFSSPQLPAHAPPLPQQQAPQHWAPNSNMAARFQSAFAPQPFMPFTPGPASSQSDLDMEMARWVATHGAPDMSGVDAAIDRMAEQLEHDEAAIAQAQPPLSDLASPEIGNLSLHESTQGHDIERHQPEPTSEYYRELHLLEQQNRMRLTLSKLETAEPETTILPQNMGLTDQDGIASSSQPQEQAEKQHFQENDLNPSKSAVSEAAKQLLDTVSHEEGDKWQKSTFLSLMRDFRDGRKDIVDNEVRQTVADGAQVPE
ncbi:hypothetical protein CDD82_577 [Ophiocordyceps australis]|uniref:Peroxin 20 n=1 Tax=Ophiocordyceps australis TaxID=1399860 RepID=A0A2C5ZNC2_9HYPO|nr:hypothetical protein CDD82_577 [Ophiocordyceps australis]